MSEMGAGRAVPDAGAEWLKRVGGTRSPLADGTVGAGANRPSARFSAGVGNHAKRG
jgi:hypothetical protein